MPQHASRKSPVVKNYQKCIMPIHVLCVDEAFLPEAVEEHLHQKVAWNALMENSVLEAPSSLWLCRVEQLLELMQKQQLLDFHHSEVRHGSVDAVALCGSSWCRDWFLLREATAADASCGDVREDAVHCLRHGKATGQLIPSMAASCHVKGRQHCRIDAISTILGTSVGGITCFLTGVWRAFHSWRDTEHGVLVHLLKKLIKIQELIFFLGRCSIDRSMAIMRIPTQGLSDLLGETMEKQWHIMARRVYCSCKLLIHSRLCRAQFRDVHALLHATKPFLEFQTTACFLNHHLVNGVAHLKNWILRAVFWFR
mmetsp:Transcript_66228/g.122262  ORF Transcript_66228/g.122262 Transcript_66228/m.122262 type:complete len:311 (+) Transcript_66228:1555-2487(+)